MAVSLTLGIVKPDAVASGKTGKIVAHLQDAGFTLRAARWCASRRSRPAPSTRSTGGGRSSPSW